jgi:hypothetical protein
MENNLTQVLTPMKLSALVLLFKVVLFAEKTLKMEELLLLTQLHYHWVLKQSEEL